MGLKFIKFFESFNSIDQLRRLLEIVNDLYEDEEGLNEIKCFVFTGKKDRIGNDQWVIFNPEKSRVPNVEIKDIKEISFQFEFDSLNDLLEFASRRLNVSSEDIYDSIKNDNDGRPSYTGIFTIKSEVDDLKKSLLNIFNIVDFNLKIEADLYLDPNTKKIYTKNYILITISDIQY